MKALILLVFFLKFHTFSLTGKYTYVYSNVESGVGGFQFSYLLFFRFVTHPKCQSTSLDYVRMM